MHNKVVYHAMKAFQAYGLPVLRFNFRGAGLSEGEHDHGRGEVTDVRIALDWLEREYQLPLLFAGFSFGSSVGLRACCGDQRVKGMAALGPSCKKPGDANITTAFSPAASSPSSSSAVAKMNMRPRAGIEAVVAGAAPPATLVMVPDADHFFAGKLEPMQRALSAWIEEHFLPPETAQ